MNPRKPHRVEANALVVLKRLTGKTYDTLQYELLDYLEINYPTLKNDWDKTPLTCARWLKGQQSFPLCIGDGITAWCSEMGLEYNISIVPYYAKSYINYSQNADVSAPIKRLLNLQALLISTKKNRVEPNRKEKAYLDISVYFGQYRQIFSDNLDRPLFAAWVDLIAGDIELIVNETVKCLSESPNAWVYAMGLIKNKDGRHAYRWNINFSMANRSSFKNMRIASLDGEFYRDDLLEIQVNPDDLRVSKIETLDGYISAMPFDHIDELIRQKNQAKETLLKSALVRSFNDDKRDVLARANFFQEVSID